MAAPKGNKGRPTKYDERTALMICERIVNGDSLRRICADDDIPAISTVMLWLKEHSEFSEQYAHARSSQADTIFEDISLLVEDLDKAQNNVDVQKIRFKYDV